MDNRFLTILKFAAFLLVVMFAVVGLLWVLSLIGNEHRRGTSSSRPW